LTHPFQQEVEKVRPNPRSIHPLILNRWSPRSMTAEPLTDADLAPLFEAARWAPSSYNNQPWRFLYGKKGTAAWPLFFNLMVEFNQGWAKNAGALVLVISKTTFDHNNKPCRTHSFDAGAAWMALALEGAGRGLVVHGMEGFDYERAKKDLKIPDDHQVEALVAIGKRAPITQLAEELQKKEAPSTRKGAAEISKEGSF